MVRLKRPRRLAALAALLMLSATIAGTGRMPAPAAAQGVTPKCVLALGDSLTYEYSGYLVPYLKNWAVVNAGLPGQGPMAIAARVGALPTEVLWRYPLANTKAGIAVMQIQPRLLDNAADHGSIAGTISGHSGELTWEKGKDYFFRPDTSFDPTTIPRKSNFVPETAQIRDCTLLLWAGRNGYQNLAESMKAITAVTDLWEKAGAPYFVLSVPTGKDEGKASPAYREISALNARLAERYGKKYVDIRGYLIDAGKARAGLSREGAADIAADTVPTDLRRDALHLNSDGNDLIARYLSQIVLATPMR